MSRLPRLCVLVAVSLMATGCSAAGTHDLAASSTASGGPPSDTRPADGHESMDHGSMPSMSTGRVGTDQFSTGQLSTDETGTAGGLPPISAPANPAPGPVTAPAPVPEPAATPPAIDVLPGMPAVADPHNIYSEAGANMLGPAAQQSKAYAYVPNTKSGDVWVIDQRTFQVVNKFPVGTEVQHVVPSYDMTALYATDDIGNVIRRIDPITGQAGDTIPVADPYNMYFTPDGRYAISVAEALRSLVWYDPATWQEVDRVRYPGLQGHRPRRFHPGRQDRGVQLRVRRPGRRRRHADPPADPDGRHAADGTPTWARRICGSRRTDRSSTSPTPTPTASGCWTRTCRPSPGTSTPGRARTACTSAGTPPSCTVTNRHEGSISVLDAYTGDPIGKWQIPGGGSPDMGNVSADGSQLWLSGRYDNVVYVISTVDGSLITKIPVGNGPHGLALMPQPGRYSIGHTGITR